MKRSILTAALLAVALFAGLASDAHGGTYKAIQCYERNGAGHHDVSYDSSSERYRSSADCEGPGLGITHEPGASRTGSGRYGAWTITAPDGTEIVRAAARVSASSQNSHVPQVHIGLEGGAKELLDGVRGDLHTIDWEGSAGSYFSSRLTCLSRDDCGDGRDAYIYMRRIALTLRDLAPPTVQLGGTLTEPGSRRGDQVLEVNAADAGSGVRSVEVELNGEPLESRVLECSVKDGVAIRVRPCPGNATPQFQIDTTGAGFRQGPNELRVCASDFAPEATANHTCETRTVRIDNECPIGETTGSVLRARFKGAGSRQTTQSNEPATVIGALTDAGGQPVRNAGVCVATRIDTTDGPPERVLATPTTGPDGRFQTRIPAGPSREVRIAHWQGAHEVIERFLDLRAKAVPRLALTPPRGLTNGDTLRFNVHIPGPANAQRRVAIQARGTGKWIRIEGGRTDRGGRWSGRYRFTNTTATRHYAFRAIIRRQPGYPYNPGKSKTRKVTVTGP
ncbi:MAG: hypothetical protein QOI31_1107 [Solirubrobacterales bacterium]|jgi:hypothetical protein|nr:hypothetical protein [Solirubrobacterales bacterium]